MGNYLHSIYIVLGVTVIQSILRFWCPIGSRNQSPAHPEGWLYCFLLRFRTWSTYHLLILPALHSFSTLVWFCSHCVSTLLPLLEIVPLVYLLVIVYFFYIEQSPWEEWPCISYIIFPQCQTSTWHRVGTQILLRIHWTFFPLSLDSSRAPGSDYLLIRCGPWSGIYLSLSC